MANVQELLKAIKEAVRGDEVRDSIHDAIYQCYLDGKAGVIDVGARGLIESAIAVNEDQETDIMDLQGRVSVLEGGSGEGTTEETTTTFDTCKILTGHLTTTQTGNSTRYVSVNFPSAFDTVPFVGVFLNCQSSITPKIANMSAGVINDSVTASGFRLFTAVSMNTADTLTLNLDWIAIAPVTTSIDTDITVPPADELTEAEIQSIEALFD